MIELLQAHDKVRTVDIELAKLLLGEPLHGGNEMGFYLLLLLLKAMNEQHSCLDLTTLDISNPFALDLRSLEPGLELGLDIELGLSQLPCIGEQMPLRLRDNALYLARYDEYEAILAERFSALATAPITLDNARLAELIQLYFGAEDAQSPNWQKVACATAATRKFCVISGGPGTGKTTTVTRLLAILQSLYREAPLHIELVAPTGKAAARLSESIQGAKLDLPQVGEDVAALIPEQAQTLHRLLGTLPYSNQFRHNRANPVHADLVVVDEASMIDISLMAKLVDALAPHTRLILLGDKDQLSSVDSGNIMADLCCQCQLGHLPNYSAPWAQQLAGLCGEHQYHSQQQTPYLLRDNIAFLQHSYRFAEGSGIGRLAYAVNRAEQNTARQLLQSDAEDISYFDLQEGFYSQLIDRAATQYSTYLNLAGEGMDAKAVHQAFAQYQLLAALREGPFGVQQLNQRIEQRLAQQGLIDLRQRFYLGMPLMISQNDYQLRLFNGDIGIVLPDEDGALKAMFIGSDGTIRAIEPGRLPGFDKVFAMTIHKSQGSEFAHTAMVLPPLGRGGQRLNRQLVYTGITRAKKHIELICDMRTLFHAINQPISRASGLYQRLQGANH
ncbi:exodeoxyribonuclease V subunit alpha [Pseudoalteromonas sp. T1lg88]|uniref:exodeoxyribonuclease V subunit alpha n=1 Tax=Pseudoalteromonas sp. T1lg88 TaxID=2077104 RepID=UPI000CF69DC9|nr:exodeoxyribonuclease V subunit alpha [Pseudoalteromonas sp. T1lg88]